MSKNEHEAKRLLQERVKELNCLYSMSKICQNFDLELTVALTKIVEAIPQGWQFENQLCVFLYFDDYIVGTSPQKNTSHIVRADLNVNQIKRGEVGVFYPDNKKFNILEEEKNLLEKIGVEISIFIERYEQKQFQDELNSTIKHADRLAVLGELTAGIAHELNTPLGNILGYAELIKKTEKDLKNKSDVQKIITSAINAREIVKKLMYFSCEMPQQFQHVSINEQLKENLSLLNKQLVENAITVSLNLADNLPLIRLDKVQFSQIVFNLTLNAICAMKHGGELIISTFLAKNSLVFSIKDNGKGIEKEHLTKIFQPFFTTSKDGKGTGLGLSVVHGLVHNHKGKITVNSIPKVGTEFNINFPLDKK